MLREVQVTLRNGVEISYLTDIPDFFCKKKDGWDMIGFVEVGKTRITWIPLGANVVEVRVYHVTSGRRLQTIDCSNIE